MNDTTAPVSLGRDNAGEIVVDFAAEVVYYLTDCCGASTTGTADGVACRACYRTVNPVLGMAWSLSDYANNNFCTVCGDVLNWCPQSVLFHRAD